MIIEGDEEAEAAADAAVEAELLERRRRRQQTKRVYGPRSEEERKRISEGLRAVERRTGRLSRTARERFEDPERKERLRAAMMKGYYEKNAPSKISARAKRRCADPAFRQLISQVKTGVAFHCKACGQAGHRRNFCPSLGHVKQDRTKRGASPILGLECSGTVESVGSHVTRWKVGDQVCALLAGGGYAEYVAVPESQILPVPVGVPLVDAAALPEAACTVWSTVFMMAKLQPGESFLVHGGSSGIGTFAIQLVKLLGSRVFCTAGSTEKLNRCRQLGADVTINYRKEDFLTCVKEETGGKGVNVILDNMGASYLEKNLSCLVEDGRMIVIGLQGGRIGSVDLGRMLMKRLSLHCKDLHMVVVCYLFSFAIVITVTSSLSSQLQA
ncbi:unnamed protein product [Closterium sp. NIES-64]|nr:unnamed protein product [Closterium sp. NIES-64]